ncbi:MAG: glycoside hydrolase family 2 protein, partial [Lachnospiraceae bacterium]|nr:glycoside hydrolase family 2 protein [Lachnospiraceae bacterium]
MQKQDFNRNWLFREEGDKDAVSVTLPHDAQIGAARSKDAPGGSGHGYFTGGKYLYTKEFDVPAEWADRHIDLLFEGVYRNAEVLVNGERAGGHRYGYTPFTVSLDGLLKPGQANTVEVRADNSELPNSRWYSGGGIYRPVWLLSGAKTFIPWQGVKVRTVSTNPARIRIATEIGGDASGTEAVLSVYDGDTLVAQGRGQEAEL